MNTDHVTDYDEIYGKMDAEAIPWHSEDPSAQLVELIEAGRLTPGRALEMGCGLGTDAIDLARRGFEVTGIDSSRIAVDQARSRADKAGVSCRFERVDLLTENTPDALADLGGPFDLVYDWELLCHIHPPHREGYLDQVRDLLRSGGRYMSVCLSEKDPFARGEKYLTTPINTLLYFSSEEELRALYEPRFEVLELRTTEIWGKYSPHQACLALLERR